MSQNVDPVTYPSLQAQCELLQMDIDRCSRTLDRKLEEIDKLKYALKRIETCSPDWQNESTEDICELVAHMKEIAWQVLEDTK